MVTLFVLAAVVLLAIMSGIAGIVIEHQRDPAQSPWRNPAVRDALLAVAGWAVLFVVSFAVELAGERLTLEFRHLLGALVMLPFYHAVLSMVRLIYLSARRIHAHARSREPYRTPAVPFLRDLAAPVLFVSAVLAAATEWFRAGGSIFFLLLASIALLLALLRRRAPQ